MELVQLSCLDFAHNLKFVGQSVAPENFRTLSAKCETRAKGDLIIGVLKTDLVCSP